MDRCHFLSVIIFMVLFPATHVIRVLEFHVWVSSHFQDPLRNALPGKVYTLIGVSAVSCNFPHTPASIIITKLRADVIF